MVANCTRSRLPWRTDDIGSCNDQTGSLVIRLAGRCDITFQSESGFIGIQGYFCNLLLRVTVNTEPYTFHLKKMVRFGGFCGQSHLQGWSAATFGHVKTDGAGSQVFSGNYGTQGFNCFGCYIHAFRI